MSSIKMWTDNETDQDLLGFSIHADLLRSIITDPKMLPLTVGLFGDWGGGKSSILKILQRDLEKDENFAVVYFNGWVFEGYEDAKSAILTSLITELRDNRNLINLIRDEANALLKRINWMKLLKMGASSAISYFTANPLPLFMAGTSIASDHSTMEPEKQTESMRHTDIDFSDLLKASKSNADTKQLTPIIIADSGYTYAQEHYNQSYSKIIFTESSPQDSHGHFTHYLSIFDNGVKKRLTSLYPTVELDISIAGPLRMSPDDRYVAFSKIIWSSVNGWLSMSPYLYVVDVNTGELHYIDGGGEPVWNPQP